MKIVREADGFGRGSVQVPDTPASAREVIPNNPLVAAALCAILKGGPHARTLISGWRDRGDGRLAYRHVGKKGGEIEVTCEPGAPTDSPEEQWRFVQSLSPLTADVMMMGLAQLCDPRHRGRPLFPTLAAVPFAANQFLSRKGYSRWGIERSHCRESFVEEMRRLLGLRFEVRDYPGWDVSLGRWNARGVHLSGDRLFEARDVRESRNPPDGDRLMDANWLITSGRWSQCWFNARGRVWTSAIPAALLELDHRRNRGIELLAKKIGFHMTLLWGAVRSRLVFERRIEHLLEDIGELPASEHRDCHWAGRLRDRFDEAMLRLREKGIFEDVSWPGGRGPGDVDRNKGWVQYWLGSTVRIRRPGGPASEPDAAPASPARRRQRTKVGAGSLVSGPDIRSLRIGRDMSQLHFADELGISTSYLSQIETGKRAANAKLMTKLQPWLTAEKGPQAQ